MSLRFLSRLAGFLFGCALVVGCSDHEPASRAAFLQYLQAYDEGGFTLLPPPATEGARDAMGRYESHLAVMEDFQAVLRDNLALMERAGAALKLNRVEDLLSRRDTWVSLRADLQRCGPALSEAKSLADQERAKLEQPPDLQAAYGSAYQRAVTQPAETAPGWCDTMLEAVADADALTNYVQGRPDQFSSANDQIQVRDPSVLKAFNALADRLNQHSAPVEEVLAKLKSWQAPVS